jgi:hypothetical protein
LPADTNCITFLIQNAGSQLNGIDYTVTLLTGYASVNFESSLQTQIITSCAGGLLAYIQIAYPTRDNVV